METRPRPCSVETETTNAIGLVLRPRQLQDFEGLGPSHDQEWSIMRSRQDLGFKGLRPSQDPDQGRTRQSQEQERTRPSESHSPGYTIKGGTCKPEALLKLI